MKKSMVIALSACVVVALLFSGCKRTTRNPLLTKPKAEVENFIKSAVNYANENSGLTLPNIKKSPNNVYLHCSLNLNYLKGAYGKSGYPPCRTYFLSMIDYAKTTEQFKGLTVDWLTSEAALKRIFPKEYSQLKQY